MSRISASLLVVTLIPAGLPAQKESLVSGYAEKAAELIQQGNLKGAEAELNKAIRLSPGDPALLTSLGGVLGMQGDLRRANVYLAKAVALKPRDLLLVRNLAANEWQLGRFAEARRHLEQLLSANSQDKAATFLLGMVCENQKDYRRSIALLSSIPDVVDRQPEALVALASSYFHNGQPDNAIAALDKLPGSAKPEILFMAARVAMDAHEYARAERFLLPIRATYSGLAAVAANLALAQYRLGRPADSETTLRTAFEAGHVNRESYLLVCKILADRGDYNTALRYAAEAAAKYPDSSEAFSTKGAMEMKIEDYPAAVTSLEKAAMLHPSAAAQREWALAEWRAGSRTQSMARFEAAIRSYPNDAEMYQAYGTLLIEDASPESRRRAMGLFQHAIELDHRAVEARFQLANIALAAGRLQEAEEHLTKAMQAAPDDSRLHFTLSRVYRRLGRDADADREMEEYRRLKK